MKKALLFLLLVVTALQLRAAVGHGYIVVSKQDGATDSIAVHGTYDISHSKTDLEGVERDDYVTLVVTTAEGEWRYPVTEVKEVHLPELRPWDRITLTGDINLLTTGNDGRKRIVFDGKFPPKTSDDKVKFKWQPDDALYLRMNRQDTIYRTIIANDITKTDSLRARFKTIEVANKEEPVYVYYPGRVANKEHPYNKVTIAREQVQTKVNDSEHIGYSGDCAGAVATEEITVFDEDGSKNDIYLFNLKHHPAFFTFLTHNPRVPSVKVKSVTMVMDTKEKPIAGTFEFDPVEGINLGTVENGKDTITLKTDFFFDNGWKHTPRLYANSQDSTAAYMVTAPQTGGVDFKFIFNVIDTLSLIDTTFVKSYHLERLKPNTFYTVNAEIPDTLFSIVDLGLPGDIKLAFRNVEAYFERGPESFYGGRFSYGESYTKNDYSPGAYLRNYKGGAISSEFTNNYDAAFQRWKDGRVTRSYSDGEDCWRMMTNAEADTLLKYCRVDSMTYNGTPGVLLTSKINGRRVFLPVAPGSKTQNYWTVDRTKKISDFYYVSDGSWHFYKIPSLVAELDNPKALLTKAERYQFTDPGWARPVIEYSNTIRSNTDYDGSLMLLRHVGESEADNNHFSINGLLRAARPHYMSSSDIGNITVKETGFVFGTDSATLYYNAERDTVWRDGYFLHHDTLHHDTFDDYLPINGRHLLMKAGLTTVGPYASGQGIISVTLSSEGFLGYLPKDQKYYVREYFVVHNPVTGEDDYYYASRATHIEGYFPHTKNVRWLVGDEDATINGKVNGVSAEVAGYMGFVIKEMREPQLEQYVSGGVTQGEDFSQDQKEFDLKADTVYRTLTLDTPGSYLQLSDNGLKANGQPYSRGDVRPEDMSFSYTLPKDSLRHHSYYFARAVFVSYTKDEDGEITDTTCLYAPEVVVFHLLDTLNYGLPSGALWANLDVRSQYPEEHDSTFVWNYLQGKTAVPSLISDIAGTAHDVVFQKWFGQDKGWVFTMPTASQYRELMECCTFEYVKDRFGVEAYKITSNVNGQRSYVPAYMTSYWGVYSPVWTSQRPPKGANDQAYYVNSLNDGDVGRSSVTSSRWVRAVLQTNNTLDDGSNSPLFVSTDTVGMNSSRSEVELWGRAIGVTPAIKADYSNNVTRGFVLHDYKYGTANDPKGSIIIDPAVKIDSINGLYSTVLPKSCTDTLQSDKDYWYRAFLRIGDGYYYGEPKKLSPLTISIGDIDWEVHGNKATLYCDIIGSVFIGKKNFGTSGTDDSVLGFVVGDSVNIDREHCETEWLYQYKEGEVVIDSTYSRVMDVPKDTIYWVRAFILSDGKIRYSEARQFGLDYVDLGLSSGTLWASINVGSAYPEDDSDYFAVGEGEAKNDVAKWYSGENAYSYGHYNTNTYIEDTLRWTYVDNPARRVDFTKQTKTLTFSCWNQKNTKKYQIPYRGAVHEIYHCEEPQYWKHYSGTKNDAALVNWAYDNTKFTATDKYVQNSALQTIETYGNLFVEPNYREWQELAEQCDWSREVVFGKEGWRVTSRKPNADGTFNSIFLPFNGHFGSTNSWNSKTQTMEWTDTKHQENSAGFYHVADSVIMVSLQGRDLKSQGYDGPSSYDSWTLTWGEFYQGHSVRPVARFTNRLTKDADKLRDNTMMYLSTDSAIYMNFRTAVALEGTFRINFPLTEGKYETGFVIDDCPRENRNAITVENKKIKAIGTKLTGSQYFAVLDEDNNLESDKTYYYRFYLKSEEYPNPETGSEYYYADADSFHMARHATNGVEWRMYETTATLHGTVEGVMKSEAGAGFEAGIIVGHNRGLKCGDSDLLETIRCTSDLGSYGSSRGGRMTATYTLQYDSTYYFRTYVKYANGTIHYGDVNLFGYELIDLGLPSGKKWASINVGGANPNSGYSTGALSHSFGINGYDQPYRNPGNGGPNDMAQTYWYNVNRMPTTEEANELFNGCTWKLDTLFGCYGLRGTSKTAVDKDGNPRTIFLRGSVKYHQWLDYSDYSLDHAYIRVPKPSEYSDNRPPYITGVSYHDPGCRGINYERPVWESNIKRDNNKSYNGRKYIDEMLIRTDGKELTSQHENVTFFGSVLGIEQRHFGLSQYRVDGVKYVGFVVGTDSLCAHKDDKNPENSAYTNKFKLDLPHFKDNVIRTDTIYFYETANINLFKAKDTVWVRAYVVIETAGEPYYYYGASIPFVREPGIVTGDVEWQVGEQQAVLHASVKGFNNDYLLSGYQGDQEDLIEMEQLAKTAEVGLVVGYQACINKVRPEGSVMGFYHLGQAANRSFERSVPYPKDTTYYYCAYIKYGNDTIFSDIVNHYGLEFVDIGLPMQWASISMGSRFSEDNCTQFAWGDTEPNKSGRYLFGEYKYFNATTDDEYYNLGNEIKGSQYDAAHVKWDYTWDESEFTWNDKDYGGQDLSRTVDSYGGRGQLWSMPSEEDLQMLVDSCTWKDSVSVSINGATTTGYKVTGPNGKSIFIGKQRCPEWTISDYHDSYGPWEYGPLWSSSRAPKERNAYGLEAGEAASYNRLMKYHYRYHGHYIRPMAHITDTLSDGKRLSITTERTSWVAGSTGSTIYGCVLGLNDAHPAISYGFVVGMSDKENQWTKQTLVAGAEGVTTYDVRENTTVVGLFSQGISPIDNTKMYAYRAFVKVNDGGQEKYLYGDIKEFGIVMVDLGLNVKWANVNMGSWKAKDHGDYYAWGELYTKDGFTEDGYQYYNSLTGNYRDLGFNISANDTTDVAQKKLGGLWRMPSEDDWNDLLTRGRWEKDTVAHIPGFRVYGVGDKSANSIFLPSNYYSDGLRDGNFDLSTNEDDKSYAVNHDGQVTRDGFYWSSNRSQNYKEAQQMGFNVAASATPVSVTNAFRYRGNGIRAVASTNRGDFYVRTEGTDWRYKKDSVNFYAAVLHASGGLPAGYKVGFLISKSPNTIIGSGQEIAREDTTTLRAAVSKNGSGNYVGMKTGFNLHDGVWYYKVYVTDGTNYWWGDARQFGLQSVDLGIEGFEWANINVDAASPEEIGLNGTPTGKYAGVDPAYAEFGSLWRTPTSADKQKLLDQCTWQEVSDPGLFDGLRVWKVTNTADIENNVAEPRFIYLTSNNPETWGYRAVAQSNITFGDQKKVYMRTDSTNWRAGYTSSNLYASLVGPEQSLSGITERGFVVGTSPEVTHTDYLWKSFAATPEQITSSNFVATMNEALPVGTYYYRAYVKYKYTDDESVEHEDYYYVSPSDAKEVGIKFVDLGLPSGVKWANVNIGSTVATDKGDRYQWGDTQVRSAYTTDTYPHYNATKGYLDIGNDISGNSTYDVAALKIDGTRMPSQAELQELMTYCVWKETTLNGVSGYVVKSNETGDSIFLPVGDYWTSSLNLSDSRYASDLAYQSNKEVNKKFNAATALRHLGNMVRPVSSLISTVGAVDIGSDQATLQAVISLPSTNFENNQTVTVGFEYASNANMASFQEISTTRSENGTYELTPTGLPEGSLFYYRAFVELNSTRRYGTTKNFVTKSTVGLKHIDIFGTPRGVQWGDRNVGAENIMPEDYGEYYAWGDTLTRIGYTQTTYTHYVNNQYSDIGNNIGATKWDIASKKYNGCWRMPTQAELNNLISQNTWTWGTKEDKQGYWVENPTTHKTIFMPAAGYREGTATKERETGGHYWTASINQVTSDAANSLWFNSTEKGSTTNRRELGFVVRPVYQTNFTLNEGGENQQDVFIRTDNANSWNDGRTVNVLSGTMLGLNSADDGLKQGFVIGTDPNVTLKTALLHKEQVATANGSYSLTLDEDDMRRLTVGDVYYVRAYVYKAEVDSAYADEALPMDDYTFFTDSVKWSLGNKATLYAHVRGVKPETGLTVGFRYATKSNMSDARIAKNVAWDGNVFTGIIDTVKVATYYYQAYTVYQGITHYGAIKSFGAEVVDLHLASGVKWVNMNLGACEPEMAGDTYRWGETAPYDSETSGEYTAPVQDNIGGTEYDAVHTRLGGNYRLPSIANLQELLDECNWIDDVNGYWVESKTAERDGSHNRIFIYKTSYWTSQKGDATENKVRGYEFVNTERTPVDKERLNALRLRPTLNSIIDSYEQPNAGDLNNGIGRIEGNE